MQFLTIGDIVDFNPYTNVISFKCEFLTPNNIFIIEEIDREKRKGIKLNFNFSPKRSKQYHQQKCWYGSIKLILIGKGVELTSENLKIEDEEQRRAIFPVKEYEIDNIIKRRPKRMSELSYEEMQEVIEILHDRHKHLKIRGNLIDFSNLKLI